MGLFETFGDFSSSTSSACFSTVHKIVAQCNLTGVGFLSFSIAVQSIGEPHANVNANMSPNRVDGIDSKCTHDAMPLSLVTYYDSCDLQDAWVGR